MEFNSFHNSWFSRSLNSLSARLALPVGTGRKLYRWLGVTMGMPMKNYLGPLIIQNWRFPPDICSAHTCQTETNRNWRMSCSIYKYWARFKNDFCRRVPNMAFSLVPFCVLWHSVQSLNITRITILLSNFLFFLKNEKREMDGRRFFFFPSSLNRCFCVLVSNIKKNLGFYFQHTGLWSFQEKSGTNSFHIVVIFFLKTSNIYLRKHLSMVVVFSSGEFFFCLANKSNIFF